MLKYITVNTAVEWMCLGVALICLTRDKSRAWRSMILLLLVICVAETVGISIKMQYRADPINVRPNIWVYNIVLLFQVGLISNMFRALFKGERNLRLTTRLGMLALLALYVFEVGKHGVFEKHIFTYLTTQVLFVLYSFVYFYLMMKDESLSNLSYDSNFWWVTGTLFFFFGSVVVTLFYEPIRVYFPDQNFISYIFKVLNVMLYTSWSYAFILRKWVTRKYATLS